MSRLDELIAELCPDGVEYKKLGEIGNFYGGLSGKTKEDFSNGNAKLITYMNVFNNISLEIDVTDTVKIRDKERQNTINYGDVIFTGSSETRNECGMSSVLTTRTTELLYLNSFCFGFRLNDQTILEASFSKYLFRSEDIRKQIIRTANGVTRFNVSKNKMEGVIIPIPPLAVQEEIVRILDNFTELTAELTAELTVRKKQYGYYKGKLLLFEDKNTVDLMALGEVCSLKAGKTIHSSDISNEAQNGFIYPCYGGNGVRGYVKKPNQVGNAPLIGRQGALCGNVCYATNEYYATEHAIIVSHGDKLNSRFLYYLLGALNLNQFKTSGAQPGLSVRILNEIEIPVPPLEEQERIVAILDRFDALCNDLTSGLPAEIEARRKQYEYYRDKLLTFKEAGA